MREMFKRVLTRYFMKSDWVVATMGEEAAEASAEDILEFCEKDFDIEVFLERFRRNERVYWAGVTAALQEWDGAIFRCEKCRTCGLARTMFTEVQNMFYKRRYGEEGENIQEITTA